MFQTTNQICFWIKASRVLDGWTMLIFRPPAAVWKATMASRVGIQLERQTMWALYMLLPGMWLK